MRTLKDILDKYILQMALRGVVAKVETSRDHLVAMAARRGMRDMAATIASAPDFELAKGPDGDLFLLVAGEVCYVWPAARLQKENNRN